jgi:serine/threonine protein kinase
MTVPATLGRYEVVGHLASGGMAEIFLGRLRGPRGFEQAVVIKRVLPSLGRTKEFVDMFVDEANIVAAVRHPNVVAVHELGHEGEELFLVMEYLEGESIGSLLRRLWTGGEVLDRRLAIHIIAQACAGLHAAHELTDENGDPRDLVHRDVTPQNVFVTYGGEVKVLDFGIAKAHNRHTKTDAGQVKGKLGYMSPEQCFGKPLDRRTDIFALGTLLYELTTSRRLFRRETELETLKLITEMAVVSPSAVLPDYPPALEAICMRALERRREDRYATAAEMRKDLLGVLASSVPPAGAPLVEEELSALMRRVFSDRMAEKQEMLRRVRSGTTLTSLPIAEVDEANDVPAIDEGSSTRSTFTTPTPRRAGRLGRSLAIGASVAIAAAVLYSTYRASDGRSRQAATESGDPPAAISGATSAPAPMAAAVPDVVVHIETVPSGATLIVGGKEQGVTPSELRLPRSDASIDIEVRRDGFEPSRQSVMPQMDQRLVINLAARKPQAAPPEKRAVPPKPPRPAPSATSGYDKL